MKIEPKNWYRIILYILCVITPVLCISLFGTPTSKRLEEVIAKQHPILEKKLSDAHLTYGAPVFIRIIKSSYTLELWIKSESTYVLFKNYSICNYSGVLGPKQKMGDKQSPEGFYGTTPRLMNPDSKYYLSFDIGYPNAYDRFHACSGSSIAIHGMCGSIGCFAMTNPCIEEIYTLVDAAMKNGQKFVPIHIFPFPLTELNVQDLKESAWHSFWEELKPGYNYFEKNHTPPEITVINGRYRIK